MRFLVETTFKQLPTPEMLALIPAETAYGLELDAKGIRERLYVAADSSRAWQVFHTETQASLDAILAAFPLAPYVQTQITPLIDESLSG
jgi:muconolactone delta-isomerase